jgi:hypothetical protein
LLKKNKPIPDKNIEPEHNDRIKTLENEAAAVSCEYKLSDFDVQELIFDKYVDKFPDTHYVDLTKLLRVKVGSNPQNYLIYSTEEEVTDTIKFKKRKFTRKRIGFHPIVTGEPQYDDYGQLTGYEIGTPRTSFDIFFDLDFIEKLISKCRSGPKELLLARGAIAGEHPVVGKSEIYLEPFADTVADTVYRLSSSDSRNSIACGDNGNHNANSQLTAEGLLTSLLAEDRFHKYGLK